MLNHEILITILPSSLAFWIGTTGKSTGSLEGGKITLRNCCNPPMESGKESGSLTSQTKCLVNPNSAIKMVRNGLCIYR